MTAPLQMLADEGVSVWLDDLSRKRLLHGDLEVRVRDGAVTGVTTNPSIFRKVLRDSELYSDELRELAHLGLTVRDTVRAVTSRDVRAACDVLRTVHDATDGIDGQVSIEVDPEWAHDTARTVADARLLWWLVDRPNVLIKIPATDEGLTAVTACLAQGISVNVTLIFSLDRYREVLSAYLDGMEQAMTNGHDLSRIASVASFFISRVDTEVDRQLDLVGNPQARQLRGRAAIANATLAYELFRRMLVDQRWTQLAAAGAHPQRPLWASTGVKDSSYDDTRYVVDLAAPGTVNTAPEATLAAVADHGVIRGDRLSNNHIQARAVLDGLSELGIDMSQVAQRLELSGISQFQQDWRCLLADVAAVALRSNATEG